MSSVSYKRTRLACYSAYFAMSSVFCVPPLLFLPFRALYGISYTLLGTLVLVNFCTQLAIDLIFTFFSRHFNAEKMVKIMPLLTSAGLVIYALAPTLFPAHAYPGLVAGTLLFSVASGLSEVLLSPTIAAMPSDNPGRDMSLLHSLYAFGVFTMVVISTLFLRLFGFENWMYLILFLACLPLVCSVLFFISPFPDMQTAKETGAPKHKNNHKTGLLLVVLCIFFGSCAENAMSNWISGYMESALGIDKSLGDILGVAMFAILLGIARLTYAKYGKNIGKVLLFGMAGATLCYLIAGLCDILPLAFGACVLTGLCTSMLWPGALIFMEENIPGCGVTAFALMAAGGDLGASVAPQWMGIVIDTVSESPLAAEIGAKTGLLPEQLGLKAGMLCTAIFPLIGVVVVALALRYFKKNPKN
jgi:hypothetical protein